MERTTISSNEVCVVHEASIDVFAVESSGFGWAIGRLASITIGSHVITGCGRLVVATIFTKELITYYLTVDLMASKGDKN